MAGERGRGEVEERKDAVEEREDAKVRPALRALNWSSLLFAILQSACTAVLTISGLRVAIGLTSLAAAAGIYAPARGFHQDAIRIPMLLFAVAGSVVNLYVIWRVRSLRKKPASQWRQRPVSPAKLRSERLQIALAVLTLVLAAAEWVTHPLVHRTGSAPVAGRS